MTSLISNITLVSTVPVSSKCHILSDRTATPTGRLEVEVLDVLLFPKTLSVALCTLVVLMVGDQGIVPQ